MTQRKRIGAEPAPAPRPNASTPGFPIVCLGASAGGLEALDEFFKHLPTDTGMGFVVVTHQHPAHTSLLPELLGKATALPVVEAADGLAVQRNHVYVGPPGGYLAILNGMLHRMETGKAESPRLPIDYFFRSLAADQKDKAICIILSGTGTDGTLGLKAIKGESGMAMVQQVQSAKYAGMPGSAVATGLADYVLPPAAMPAQLVSYARGPFLTVPRPTGTESLAVTAEPMQKVFVLLRSRTGHDFSAYKPTTIRRRIERRMNLHQIDEPKQYVRYLQEYPSEIDLLFRELLISVTSFFRDPEAFQLLASSVLPKLLKSRPDKYTFRGWVPGCSSGEEVFSLAILLRECMETAKRPLEVQIFGTDLDTEAIEAARAGQYPDGIAGDLSARRLERFFIREDSAYRIRTEVREMTIFAVQNAIKDPPFTKLDLISCRNLLIYLNSDLQRRLLPMFHYALKPGGILVLGPSETVGGATDLFEVVDKKWKIFRRKESPLTPHPMIEFPAEAGKAGKADLQPGAPAPARPAKEANLSTVLDRLLLARFAPASVVVNDRGDIVYIYGRTGAFLEPSPGQPRLNILDMAREGLQMELASALREASAWRQASDQVTEVTREGLRVKTNGDHLRVDLSVAKLWNPESVRGLLLVTVRPTPDAEEPAKIKGGRRQAKERSRVQELERALHYTKESLQTTIEELETSNEELKSTNEELQSTNEELETSKEEMQSLNEELSTVNTEMQSKVEQLSRANDDMQNLLNSIEIPTIFLDNDLQIKRYTEQAKRLVKLIQTDVGRPLGDLAPLLKHDRLVADCQKVLRTLDPQLSEVQSTEDRWYLMRIMPYRTAENVIDGLVLTFVDIHPVKEAERHLRRMSKVFLHGLDPMLIVDLKGLVLDLNDEAVRTYGRSREELLGQPAALIVPRSRHKELQADLKRCRQGEIIRNAEGLRIDKRGRELKGLVTLSLLTDEHGAPEAISMITKHVSA